MDKRSWPWRRKSSEKLLESAESSPAHSSRLLEDQVVSGVLVDHTRMPDAAMVQQQQQSEEKIKRLNERLLAADDLVKQHVKVAEEAVSGWEKSKAEAAALKQQLDTVFEQKRATEDRVSHLDGALKECMRQLRYVREEQEQKIHEAIVKKTRDWDKLRSELEGRLADVEQQLLEAGQENNVMYKSIQEQAKTITEISEARSQAEAEVEVLQIRLNTFEKENASLKYEVFILNKELEIRSEERDLSKRSADNASKKQMEHVKKITKLEAECQRLRILVRRKLPGPGALAQMKLEVEALDKDKDKGESNRRRSGGKVAGSPKAAYLEPLQDQESEGLSERLLTMEEETKMLKEALAKRNSELQAARLMCARTAGKLSTVEQQLDAVSRSQGLPKTPGMTGLDMHLEASTSLNVSKEPSQASMSEDGNDEAQSCADSWASALITELAHFKREKVTHNPDKILEASDLDLVDDFIEIERLASIPSTNKDNATAELNKSGTARQDTGKEIDLPAVQISLKQLLAKREAELKTANQLCQEVSRKLAVAEEQLSSLRSKSAENELNLFSLQQKLAMIFEAQEGGSNAEKVLEDVKAAIKAARCTSVAGLQAHVRQLSKGSYLGSLEGNELENHPRMSASAESSSEEEASFSMSDVKTKACAIGPELTAAICKVVRLVEDLALAITAHHFAVSPQESHRSSVSVSPAVDSDNNGSILPSTQYRPMELDTNIRKFIAVSNQFLHGKVEIVQFMAELSSILSQITRIDFSAAYGSPHSTMKSSAWSRPFPQVGEPEELGGSNSPVSATSKSDGSEKAVPKVVPAGESITDAKEHSSAHALEIEEELRNIRSEKAGLESHMRAEFARIAGIEEEFAWLKREKIELENILEEEKEKLEQVKVQMHEAEQLVASLRVRLASAESSKHAADEKLSNMAASKAELELQLKASEVELNELYGKMEALEKSITEEHIRNEDLQAKCEDFQQQLQNRAGSNCSRCAVTVDNEAKTIKEQEIADAAEKLAECQRTILVLGKQLKELASPRDPMDMSFDSSADPALHVGKVSLGGHDILPQNQEDSSKMETNEKNTNTNALEQEESFSSGGKRRGRGQRIKQNLLSDPGESNISDILDTELDVFSKYGHSSGRTISDLFGDKSPVHEDYIQAVAQMPSSPETEQSLPLVKVAKPASKKKSPRSFAGIDLSKSLNLGSSPSSQKHGSSFSRFFSRNKSGQ